MANFVYLLAFLAVFISAGNALKCYDCNSDKIDGCLKSTSPKEQTCAAPTGNFQNVCAYTVFYDTNKKTDVVHAGCELIDAKSPVNANSYTDCKTPKPGFEKKECVICNTDLCASASVFTTSLFALLCFPVMYFFTKHVLY